MERHDGRHVSAVVADEQAYDRAVLPFVTEALGEGHRVVYFADSHRPAEVLGLLESHGVDTRAGVGRGQLQVVSSTDSYLARLPFDPGRVVDLWHEAVASARRDGYVRLCAVGEMSWSERGVPGAERLLEYELRIHQEVFAELPLDALCVYDRRLVSDGGIAVADRAHLEHAGDGHEDLPRPELTAAPARDGTELRLTGEVSHDGRQLIESVGAVLAHGRAERIDLSDVSFVDLAGARQLAETAVRAPRGRVTVRDAPPSLYRVLELLPALRERLVLVTG